MLFMASLGLLILEMLVLARIGTIGGSIVLSLSIHLGRANLRSTLALASASRLQPPAPSHPPASNLQQVIPRSRLSLQRGVFSFLLPSPRHSWWSVKRFRRPEPCLSIFP